MYFIFANSRSTFLIFLLENFESKSKKRKNDILALKQLSINLFL